MPIPSGCCSRLAFRCVRFPAAVLSLRFYRRAGFPVPSVRQSVVRSGFPLRPFSGSGPRLAVLSPRRVSRSVRTVVRSGSPLCIRFPAAALGLRFSAVPGFPFRPDSRSFGLSVVRPFSGCVPRLAVFPPCRVSRSVGLPDVSDSLPPTFFAASLSVAPLCLLLSLPLLSLCCPSLSSSLFAAPLSAPSPALPLRPALGRHYLKSRYSFVYLISEKG